MSGSYDVGDLVRLDSSFLTSTGGPVAPSAVRFLVKDPNAVVTTYTTGSSNPVVADTTTTFHLQFTPDTAGKWYYRCESSTGADGQAAEESWFKVLKQQVST